MFQVGSIIIYKNTCAIVREKSLDKFLIEYANTNGKKTTFDTQKIREKDGILLHKGECKNLSEVFDLSNNTDIIEKFQSTLSEGHELLTSDEQTAKNPINLKDLAELTLGHFNCNESYAFFKAVSNSDFFAFSPDGNETSPSEECQVYFLPRDMNEIEKLRAKEKEKEQELQIRQEFIQRLKQKKIKLPEDSKFMQEIEAFVLCKTDKSKVLKDAGLSEKIEKAHKLLIDTGFWNIERNPHPTRRNLSMQSATEHLMSPPEEERLEVNHIAYAIDNAWSTDPDDAIAFDGEYLWVHVADPASTVYPDTKIDIAARNRGSTLYIPEGAARMLAEESLEDYALGLSEPRKKSKALSFRIKLNETGAIEDTRVFKTLVYVERLTYEEASEQKNSEKLKPLFDIAEINIKRRKNSGAVFIELPEVHINVDSDKKVSIEESSQNEASIVVREAMLLAGEAAAKFAFKNNLPFPYISQESPDLPKDLPEGLAGQYKLRRSMRSRSVGITPSAHAGLGLGMYSQVTSPLRRYGDLVAHQQLRAFIDGKEPLNKDSMLERIAAGDAASSSVVKADRESRLHWTLIYLLQNPQWTGEGICVEQRGKQSVFIIPSLAQETLITTGGNYQLNEKVTLRAGNINIPELNVDFIIC